jgi:hypothetical protein
MRRLVAVLTVACGVAACEAIVPSDLPPYVCRGSDPSTCPAGQYCDGAHCVACDSDHCSALDGGGDGSTFDATGDGDATKPPADGPPPQDVTSDDSVLPDSPGCGGGALGCPCNGNVDCASHICGDATVLSATFHAMAGSVCTQTCCTSDECPAGFVCYGAGTGGSYCVAATTLSRPSVPAGAGPGAACSGAGSCRSGMCTSGHCVDTCCADAQCTASTVCSFTAGIDQHSTFVCLLDAGSAAKSACTGASTCANNVCSFSTCRPHCCGIPSATQTGYHSCAIDSVGSDAYTYADFPTTPPSGGDFGAACTTDDQCKSRLCFKGTGTCSDHCCLDGDCASYGSFVCRPAQVGPSPLTTQFLVCVSGP